MNPAVLAGVWAGCGVAAAVLLPPLRRRRLGWVAPLAAGLAGLAAASRLPWPGPAASPSYGAGLVLGRPALGLLLLAGPALAVGIALAPTLDGGEVLTACLVGAACAVVLSATVPVVWSLAVAVAVGALTVRWVARAPARATLNAGRIAGLGAAVLVAASTFLVPAAPAGPRAALAGGLLAGGVAAVLGLLPVGGWAVATARTVRGVDLAPWAMLLAPSLLLTVGALLPGLPAGSRTPVADVLLCLGIASALAGAVRAATAAAPDRYARVLLADLALAAAGLGTGHDQGRSGLLIILVTHLCTGPLLLQEVRDGTERPTRLAWLGLSGVPPSPAFWGRLLVLEGLAATSGLALLLGLLATIPLLAAAMRAVLEPGAEAGDLPPAETVTRLLAWVVAIAAIGIGIAPGGIAARIFGVELLG